VATFQAEEFFEETGKKEGVGGMYWQSSLGVRGRKPIVGAWKTAKWKKSGGNYDSSPR